MPAMKNGTARDSARMFLRTEAGAALRQDGPAVLVVRPVAQQVTVVVQDDVGRDRATITVTELGELRIVDHDRDQSGSTTIAVTLDVEVTDDNVKEVMEVAFSGGINYWADEGQEHAAGAWAIYDRAAGTRHEVSGADIRRAIRVIASGDFAAVDADATVHGDVRDVLRSSADGYGFDDVLIDAAAADQIVQVAAFGRVIHS